MSSDSVRSPSQGPSFAGLSCLRELSIETRIVQGTGSDSEENYNGNDICVELAGLPSGLQTLEVSTIPQLYAAARE